ncbi:hypothetical protein Rhom172_1477 [Rhodothermus marinus SG0.5JP17-172]|uniref:hypothetical protein n=2 Tax=Rhodothermus marinus TaxID=29549 RepID=UPI000223D85D|nr:hypothetical protein [Rhodothermus marinus]AEN73399.1 hypothetical protein Rhom172_1477 [Rhodothermus marinus SG0.5JP17-172]
MRRFAGLILWLVLTPVVRAQTAFQGSVYFLAGIPQGEFRTNVDNAGFGLDFDFGWRFLEVPLFLGAEAGFMIYGVEHRREPFSLTIPDVTVDVETVNNMAMGHLLMRLQPGLDRLWPFVEGLIGGRYFYTRTTIESEQQREIAVSNNYEDVALSYGYGGGLEIELYRNPTPKRTQRFLIHLGGRYLYGSEAEYLRKGSIRRENGRVVYDVYRSRTNVLIWRFGVTFHF